MYAGFNEDVVPFSKCCDRVFFNPDGGRIRGSHLHHLHSRRFFARLNRYLPHPGPRTFFSGLGCQGSRVAG
jgi:hypothetical protein